MATEIEDLGIHASRARVEALAGFGLAPAEIATLLDVDIETLRKGCGRELEAGAIKANARVAESLFRMATAGEGRESVSAAIFWLKTRARWKETSVHQHAGADGSPISFVTVYEEKPGSELSREHITRS